MNENVQTDDLPTHWDNGGIEKVLVQGPGLVGSGFLHTGNVSLKRTEECRLIVLFWV